MNKLFDLRFVIGCFFSIVGVMLAIYSFTTETGEGVNRWCGIAFLVFGVLMIVLSLGKDAHDEIL
jgi:hypothetical protein